MSTVVELAGMALIVFAFWGFLGIFAAAMSAGVMLLVVAQGVDGVRVPRRRRDTK